MIKKLFLLLSLLTSTFSLAATHSIVVLWDASTTPGVTYTVKRSTVSGGPYTTQVSNLTGLTYTDNGLAPNTHLCYVATSFLLGIESVISNEACGTTLPDPVVPAAPRNLRIGTVN